MTRRSPRSETKRRQSLRALSDLIGHTAPRADSDALARALLDRYGSLAPIVESHERDLRSTHGVSKASAEALSLISRLARYLSLDAFGQRPMMNTFARAHAYLDALYIGRYYEHCYILSLDRSGRLIECTLTQQGTVDKAPFYIRLLLEAAIRTEAYAVIISHNHPSGTFSVSQADAAATRSALTAFSQIGVIMLDHIILCDGAPLSIRRETPAFEQLFRDQFGDDPLFARWFDE